MESVLDLSSHCCSPDSSTLGLAFSGLLQSGGETCELPREWELFWQAQLLWLGCTVLGDEKDPAACARSSFLTWHWNAVVSGHWSAVAGECLGAWVCFETLSCPIIWQSSRSMRSSWLRSCHALNTLSFDLNDSGLQSCVYPAFGLAWELRMFFPYKCIYLYIFLQLVLFFSYTL